MSTTRVLVVDATQHRTSPKLTAQLNALSARVVTAASQLGYAPTRISIADIPEAEIDRVYREHDAIVVMGGDDVDPKLYGAASGYSEESAHVTVADQRTIQLITRAAADSTPVFGICRGLQLINVAHGGSLIQHLPEADTHRIAPGPGDDGFLPHPVTIEPDSKLSTALGEYAESTESSHHQAVDRLGAGIHATAWAPDGVIEAIEHTSAPQFAVQWHPEAPNATPHQLAELLRTLVKLAGRSK